MGGVFYFCEKAIDFKEKVKSKTIIEQEKFKKMAENLKIL